MKYTMGETLLELRRNINLTQKEVADILHVADSTVSKWENDGSEPSTNEIRELAKLFNVDANYILNHHLELKQADEAKEKERKTALKNLETQIHNDARTAIYCQYWNEEIGLQKSHAKREYDNGVLSVYQDENPEHVLYDSVIGLIKSYQGVELKKCYTFESKTNSKTEQKVDKGKAWITFDFKNPIIEKIVLVFSEKEIAPFEFSVNYVHCNEDAYYKKIEEERRQQQIEKSKIQFSTGINLLNIFYVPVVENYSYAKAKLYKGWDKDREKTFVGEYLNEKCNPVIKIDNMADGNYHCIVEFFDRDNNLLLISNAINFTIFSDFSHSY